MTCLGYGGTAPIGAHWYQSTERLESLQREDAMTSCTISHDSDKEFEGTAYTVRCTCGFSDSVNDYGTAQRVQTFHYRNHGTRTPAVSVLSDEAQEFLASLWDDAEV